MSTHMLRVMYMFVFRIVIVIVYQALLRVYVHLQLYIYSVVWLYHDVSAYVHSLLCRVLHV